MKKGALKHYQQKLHQYQEQEAETLIDIGVIFLEEDQGEKALKHFQDALKTYKKLEYPEGEAFTHDLIGDTYLTTRNITKALQHYQDSFKIYASLKSPLKNEIFDKIKEAEKAEEVMEIVKNKKAKQN